MYVNVDAEWGLICLAKEAVPADCGNCHSQSREGMCSKHFSFSLPFFFFFFLFQIGNSSWCCHRSFLCILPSPFSVLLTFNTSLHPFLPFFSSSYNCCSHHCSALLPFSPWHVSLDHLFAAQKATCCSECARTASRPSLALNTEHMLSQLSRAQQ